MNNDIKKSIIPEEWKEDIDDIMEKQLFNANRYYAENNPKLSEIVNTYAQLTSNEFLKVLKKQWNWHNKFYEELLEPVVNSFIQKSSKELSPKEVLELKKIYKTMCKVDEATLAISAGIKKHLENNMKKNFTNNISNKISNEELYMACTPPEETFFIRYYKDHLRYLIAQKQNNITELKEIRKELLDKYHANDDKIFKGRLKKFKNLENLSVEELEKKIRELNIDKDYQVKHLYFTMENPQKKAYRDILLYDNLQEKHIAKSLIGISGFVLRKKILEYLKEENLIESDEHIYQYPDSKIEKVLDQLYNIRKVSMEKDVKPYRQHGPTCAVCSLLMTLDFYKKINNPNRLMERELYKKYKSTYMDGSHYSGIANQLARQGLNVMLLHSEKNFFKNENNFIPDSYDELLDEYKQYLRNINKEKLDVKCGVNINEKLLREALQNNNLILLAGTQGEFLHSIVICGYENNRFIICDPQSKEREKVTEQEIKKFMDTPIGKWCIVVNNKSSEKDELIEACDLYCNQAENFLNYKTEREKFEDER